MNRVTRVLFLVVASFGLWRAYSWADDHGGPGPDIVRLHRLRHFGYSDEQEARAHFCPGITLGGISRLEKYCQEVVELAGKSGLQAASIRTAEIFDRRGFRRDHLLYLLLEDGPKSSWAGIQETSVEKAISEGLISRGEVPQAYWAHCSETRRLLIRGSEKRAADQGHPRSVMCDGLDAEDCESLLTCYPCPGGPTQVRQKILSRDYRPADDADRRLDQEILCGKGLGGREELVPEDCTAVMRSYGNYGFWVAWRFRKDVIRNRKSGVMDKICTTGGQCSSRMEICKGSSDAECEEILKVYRERGAGAAEQLRVRYWEQYRTGNPPTVDESMSPSRGAPYSNTVRPPQIPHDHVYYLPDGRRVQESPGGMRVTEPTRK